MKLAALISVSIFGRPLATPSCTVPFNWQSSVISGSRFHLMPRLPAAVRRKQRSDRGVLVINRAVVTIDDVDQWSGLARDQVAFALVPVLDAKRLAEFVRRVVSERCVRTTSVTFPKSSAYSAAISESFLEMSLNVCQSLLPSQEH